MITERDVERHLDKAVRVKTTDGGTFDGLYKYWQLGASLDVPDAMNFYPLDGMDLKGGMVEIPAAEIVSVRALDH